ncbi:MAG TPA: energy transducer TonB [Saprospiraceae bacterium]|nr:energy transducer TonB [Saprospiraceae bacterium]
MKKLIFILTLLIQVSLSFGQTLYNQNSIYLGYSKEKFNTVEFEGETYDQYEVTIIFRNDNPTKYLHEPRVCQVRFLPDIKHPSSNSEIDFAQNGEAYGYVEYTDGTPLPENLNSPKEEDKYGRVISRMIIEPKQENKCRKYILIKSGSEFPEPNYSLDFDNQIPVFVNGSTSLVATWVNRQAKGISLDNVNSWPMIIRKPFDGTNCGGAKPIGNKGDLPNSDNQEASFDGDFTDFIQENLIYPMDARDNDIQGRVIVSFVIDKSGNISDVKAISGPKELYLAAENTIRKSNGMWIPARKNNKFVSEPSTTTINFQLK